MWPRGELVTLLRGLLRVVCARASYVVPCAVQYRRTASIKPDISVDSCYSGGDMQHYDNDTSRKALRKKRPSPLPRRRTVRRARTAHHVLATLPSLPLVV